MNTAYFENYSKVTKEKAIERQICRQAANFYQQKLFSNDGSHALHYHLELEYEISVENALDFEIGFAPEKEGELTEYLIEKGFLEQDLAKSSLFEFDENKGLQEVFQNRLVVPIRDEYGNYIGFCGRTFEENKPKHLISSNSPAFSNKDHLFGLNFAYDQEQLILCEGYMDVIKLAEEDIAAVSTFGTLLSCEQVALLKKYTNKVFVNFEGDAAGARFCAHALELLIEAGLSVDIIT